MIHGAGERPSRERGAAAPGSPISRRGRRSTRGDATCSAVRPRRPVRGAGPDLDGPIPRRQQFGPNCHRPGTTQGAPRGRREDRVSVPTSVRTDRGPGTCHRQQEQRNVAISHIPPHRTQGGRGRRGREHRRLPGSGRLREGVRRGHDQRCLVPARVLQLPEGVHPRVRGAVGDDGQLQHPGLPGLQPAHGSGALDQGERPRRRQRDVHLHRAVDRRGVGREPRSLRQRPEPHPVRLGRGRLRGRGPVVAPGQGRRHVRLRLGGGRDDHGHGARRPPRQGRRRGAGDVRRPRQRLRQDPQPGAGHRVRRGQAASLELDSVPHGARRRGVQGPARQPDPGARYPGSGEGGRVLREPADELRTVRSPVLHRRPGDAGPDRRPLEHSHPGHRLDDPARQARRQQGRRDGPLRPHAGRDPPATSRARTATGSASRSGRRTSGPPGSSSSGR